MDSFSVSGYKREDPNEANAYACVPSARLQDHKIELHPEKSYNLKELVKTISKIASSILVVPTLIAGVALLAAKQLRTLSKEERDSPYTKTAIKITYFILQWLLISPLSKRLFGNEKIKEIFNIRYQFNTFLTEVPLSKTKIKNATDAVKLIEDSLRDGDKTNLPSAFASLIENDAGPLLEKLLPILSQEGIVSNDEAEYLKLLRQQLPYSVVDYQSTRLEIYRYFFNETNTSPPFTSKEASELITLLKKLDINPEDIPKLRANGIKMKALLEKDLNGIIEEHIDTIFSNNTLVVDESELDQVHSTTLGNKKVSLCDIAYADFFANPCRSLDHYVAFPPFNEYRLKDKTPQFYENVENLAKQIPKAPLLDTDHVINIILYYCSQKLTIPLAGNLMTIIVFLSIDKEYSCSANSYHISLSPALDNQNVINNRFTITFETTLAIRPYKITMAIPEYKDAILNTPQLDRLGLGSCCNIKISATVDIECANPTPKATVKKYKVVPDFNV